MYRAVRPLSRTVLVLAGRTAAHLDTCSFIATDQNRMNEPSDERLL